MLDISTINQMLISIAKTMGFICLLFMAMTLVQRYMIIRRKKREEEINEEISQRISEVLFFDSKKAKQSERAIHAAKKSQLREWSAHKEYRRVIVDQLLKLQMDVTGGTRIALMALYKDLGLHLFAVQQLNSWRWSVVASAILELSQMHITEAYIPIRKFLNDRRKTVREQAEIAVIALKEEGISHYLDTLDAPISECQQFKIIETLRSKTGFDLPIFSRWFTSGNPDVVMLAMRMADAFDQRQISQDLDTVLDHTSFKVRELAYAMVKKFKVKELVPKIKSHYWQSEDKERSLILKTLDPLGGKEDLAFLEEILAHETREHHVNQALKTMEKVAPDRARTQNKKIKEMLLEDRTEKVPIKVPRKEQTLQSGPKRKEVPLPVEEGHLLSHYFKKDNFDRYMLLDKVLKMHNPTYLPMIRKIVEREENLSIKIKALEIMQDLGVTELHSGPMDHQNALVSA